MGLLEDLAEKRIRNAMSEGAFDELPGRGRRLDLDDDSLVPEDMRLAYRVLKNAGFIPEELELRREIANVQAMLDQALDRGDRRLANRRLALLRIRLAARDSRRPVHLDGAYDDHVRRRLGSEPNEA
jgi:hypothetical protein